MLLSPKAISISFHLLFCFLAPERAQKVSPVYKSNTDAQWIHNSSKKLELLYLFQHLWFKNVNVSPLYATNWVSLKTQLILEDEKTSSKKSFFYYIKKYCLSCFPGQSAAFTFTTAEQVQVKVRQHKYLSQSDLQTSVFINQTKYMTYSPWLYTSKLTNHSLFVFKSSVEMM